MKHLVIVGCGDVGIALGQRMLEQGWQVSGLRRDPTGLPEGFGRIAADLTSAQRPADWPARVDYLVYCPAAGRRDAELYRQLYVEGLKHVLDWVKESRHKPRHLLQVSSTAVYGQSAGEWVTENSPALADTPTAPLLVEAEDIALRSGMPASVVRLAGIYGPGRTRLIEQVRQGLHVPVSPEQFTNRIHRDDAAGLLAHLLLQADKGELLAPCYLGVDDEPAALREVAQWLAEKLSVTLLEEGATSSRLGSKRCSNALARESGWQPQYPSYREGYAEMLA
ncbi:MAG: NAD-dependent epimerase/dehydratase family protein [Pseudomonas sp.]